jgi:hypothetical protein
MINSLHNGIKPNKLSWKKTFLSKKALFFLTQVHVKGAYDKANIP